MSYSSLSSFAFLLVLVLCCVEPWWKAVAGNSDKRKREKERVRGREREESVWWQTANQNHLHRRHMATVLLDVHGKGGAHSTCDDDLLFSSSSTPFFLPFFLPFFPTLHPPQQQGKLATLLLSFLLHLPPPARSGLPPPLLLLSSYSPPWLVPLSLLLVRQRHRFLARDQDRCLLVARPGLAGRKTRSWFLTLSCILPCPRCLLTRLLLFFRLDRASSPPWSAAHARSTLASGLGLWVPGVQS